MVFFGPSIHDSGWGGAGDQRRAENKTNSKKGFHGGEVGGGEVPKPMAPVRQSWGNMSAAHVVSKSVSVSCACKHARERARRSSRLATTSRSEALLGPISRSPNLQTTLGTLSTYDESLPA